MARMEKLRYMMIPITQITVVSFIVLFNLALTNAFESPQYSIVHVESDFQVRLYSESTWMSAPAVDLSFEKATICGFSRLFQYTQGANLNSSRLPMTVPILTTIVPGAGPLHSSAYAVRLYLPSKFQAEPPSPLPDLDLEEYTWGSRCVAVRRFYGFATDEFVVKEAERLSKSLSRSPLSSSITTGDDAYSVAQYSPPLQIIGRVNEVWVDVAVDGLDGCGSGSAPGGASAS